MLPILNIQQEGFMYQCRKEAADSFQNAHDTASIPQKESASAGYETLNSSLKRPLCTGLI